MLDISPEQAAQIEHDILQKLEVLVQGRIDWSQVPSYQKLKLIRKWTILLENLEKYVN